MQIPWFDLIQTAGIIGSLAFTGYALYLDSNIRKIQNLIRITENHRNIWTQIYERPELTRVLESNLDLSAFPLTREEEVFVTLVILHLHATLTAIQAGVLTKLRGLDDDIRQFFSRPIPNAVWHKVKHLQDPIVVQYLDNQLKIVWGSTPTNPCP